MASSLSPVIVNTFGLPVKGMIQPEFPSLPPPGFESPADFKSEQEYTITGSPGKATIPDEEGRQTTGPQQPEMKDNRFREPVYPRIPPPANEFPAAVVNQGNQEERAGKIQDVPPKEVVVVKTALAETNSGIAASPVKVGDLHEELPRKSDQRSISAHDLPLYPQPPLLLKENREEAQEVRKTIPIVPPEMVRPEVQPLTKPQLPQEQIDNAESRTYILPREPMVTIPAVDVKQGTRLVIGKLTVEVVQAAKEKEKQIPATKVINTRPVQASQTGGGGGPALKIKYGLGQI